MTHASAKLRPWRDSVAYEAMAHRPQGAPWRGPVRLDLVFSLRAPAKIPDERHGWPCTTPDLDKLIRTVGDAIKGILIDDDAQVCELHVTKIYYEPEGVQLTLTPLLQTG